jgi:hypothetical protein
MAPARPAHPWRQMSGSTTPGATMAPTGHASKQRMHDPHGSGSGSAPSAPCGSSTGTGRSAPARTQRDPRPGTSARPFFSVSRDARGHRQRLLGDSGVGKESYGRMGNPALDSHTPGKGPHHGHRSGIIVRAGERGYECVRVTGRGIVFWLVAVARQGAQENGRRAGPGQGIENPPPFDIARGGSRQHSAVARLLDPPEA